MGLYGCFCDVGLRALGLYWWLWWLWCFVGGVVSSVRVGFALVLFAMVGVVFAGIFLGRGAGCFSFVWGLV